jgi:hypothetical protein
MSEERREKLDIPDRRKNTYTQLESHLDERIDCIEGDIHKWIRRGLIAFGVIALCTTLALVGYAFLLSEIADTRKDFVRSGCKSQNEQHDSTTKALTDAADRDIANAKKHLPTSQGQVTVKEIENRRDVTLALIDLLRPKQDCDYLVRLSVGDATPTPAPIRTPLPTMTPTPTP